MRRCSSFVVSAPYYHARWCSSHTHCKFIQPCRCSSILPCNPFLCIGVATSRTVSSPHSPRIAPPRRRAPCSRTQPTIIAKSIINQRASPTAYTVLTHRHRAASIPRIPPLVDHCNTIAISFFHCACQSPITRSSDHTYVSDIRSRDKRHRNRSFYFGT